MARKSDIVYDLIFYIRKMKHKDRTLFKKFIVDKKNEAALSRMFRSFEKCDPLEDPQGLVKRLIALPEGSEYRLFLQFKSLLFEFEITSKRVRYFKKEDTYTYLLIELKKEFLAAQMLTERDAYLTSIQSMTETFRRAEKFEFLEIQRNCAQNLSLYCLYTGNARESKEWASIKDRSEEALNEYNRHHFTFDDKLNRVSCCDHHRDWVEEKQRVGNSSYIKINWMIEVLNLNTRDKMNAEEAFIKSNQLLQRAKRNPGVFPKHFKAIILRNVLEDLYLLKKKILLDKFACKIYKLDFLPVYRRLPLLNFFLFYLLKSGNSRIMDLLLDDIDSDSAFNSFEPFLVNKRRVQALYLITNGHYKSALRLISRQGPPSFKCLQTDFELRIAELVCLAFLNEEDLAFDKVESLRRFIFRNEALNSSLYCHNLYGLMRKIISKGDVDKTLISRYPEKSVYDVRGFIAEKIIGKLAQKVSYASKAENVKIAEKEADRYYLPKKDKKI